MSHSPTTVPTGFSDERLPLGSHVCYIYAQDDERLDVVSKYLRAGIDSRERLLYVTDTLSPEDLRDVMRQRGVDLSDGEQAIVDRANDAYAPNNRFSSEAMLDEVREFYCDAQRRGFAGARTVGEMNWATRDVECADTALEYEAKVNDLLKHYPCTCMCQYDARLFSGDLLMDVLQVHPYMVVRGQLVQNPYYVEPDVFLEDYYQRHPLDDESCRADR